MMNEVQPLLNSILDEANQEAEEIREAGRLKARKLQEGFKARAEQRRSELLAEAEKKTKEEKSRQKIQAQLEMKRELLEEKAKIIDGLFQTVRDRLTQMEAGAYQRLMLRLVIEALHAGEQEAGNSPAQLILSPRDQERLGRNFVEQVSQELKKEGLTLRGGLTLGEADPALSGGFFLRQGKIAQNYSLENLVNAKREELLPEIGRRLFS